MSRHTAALAWVLFALPSAAAAQKISDVRGGFVMRLGRDTVAIERYERRADRLEGEIALRVPTTTYIRYQTDWRLDGSVRRSVARIEPLGNAKASPRTVTLDFIRDSIRVTTDSGSLHRVEMKYGTAGIVPMITGPYGTSYATYEWLMARATHAESVKVPIISPLSLRPGSVTFVRRSPTRADIVFFGEALMPATLDADGGGRLMSVDASQTTVRVNAQRVDGIDVAKIAHRFGALDREGKSVGIASPPDSVRAVVQGVEVAIDYSSPRMRGRAILGELLPYGVVWRTGANAATVLVLDKDLSVGGQTIPAGRYSLWTVPRLDGAELIVNREHGQWGTDHDATKDFLRIPLKMTQSAAPRENFVIEVTPGSDLCFRWSTFIWTAHLARP